MSRRKISSKARKRASVIRRDGTSCYWCGEPDAPTLDHVIPRSAGGSDRIENLVLACNDCQQAKGGIHGPNSTAPGLASRQQNHKSHLFRSTNEV